MRRPSPALVLSCIAVFLSAAGGAVAAGQINGKQIKDGSVTGKDIKNDSLTGTDIKGDVRGPKGPPGSRGPQGLAGLAGSGGVNVSYQFGEATISTDGLTTVDVLCPAGQVAVGGGFIVTPPVTVRSSQPGEAGGRDGGSWTVLFEVEGDPPRPIGVRAFAVCASRIGPPGPA
jgi:hypothetical protein